MEARDINIGESINPNTNGGEIINPNKNKETLDPQNEKEEKSCESITCWWLQGFLWLGELLLLYVDAYEKDSLGYENMTVQFLLILIFELILYIIYFIFQLLTPTFSYLLHKRSDSNLYDTMKGLFNTPPQILFVCQNYHYETRTYTTYDSKGNASTRTETVKVVTRVDKKFFNFYSSRDVSGLFRLNYDKSSVRDKYYVKLQLFKNIEFADSVTYSDYQKQRDEFYNSNLGYDTYMDFYADHIIAGFIDYNLIHITKNNPCGMSLFWFFFFVLIGLAQLYKVYINSRCVYKTFTVKKLISTRYDLTNEENDNKYRKVDPVISFEGEKINFSINEMGYVSNDFIQELPTLQEIEESNQYKDFVFNPDSGKGDVLLSETTTPYVENENNDSPLDNNNNLDTNILHK